MNASTHQIVLIAPTSPDSYVFGLAEQALPHARVGQRVALLVVGDDEERAVERRITRALAPGESEWVAYPTSADARLAYRPRRLALQGGGSIFLATDAEQLRGLAFDLIVASGAVRLDSDLLQEARGRLVGAHQ